MSGAQESAAPFWISLAVALAIHLAAAGSLFLGSTTPGAGKQQTAAVSLNMVQTLIIKAADPNEREETASDDAEVSPDEGAIEDSAPSPAEMESQEDDKTEKAKAAGQDKAKPEDVKPRQQTKRKSQLESPLSGGKRISCYRVRDAS